MHLRVLIAKKDVKRSVACCSGFCYRREIEFWQALWYLAAYSDAYRVE